VKLHAALVLVGQGCELPALVPVPAAPGLGSCSEAQGLVAGCSEHDSGSLLKQRLRLLPGSVRSPFPDDDSLVVRARDYAGPFTATSARWKLGSVGKYSLGILGPSVPSSPLTFTKNI
jgi:hypothetical protein